MPPNIGKLDFSLLPEPECEHELVASEMTTPSPAHHEPHHQPVDTASYWNTERTASDLSRASKGLKPPPQQQQQEQQEQGSCSARQNPDNDDYWAEAGPCTSSSDREDVNVKYFIDYSRLIGRGHKTIVRKCIERSTGKRFAIKSVNKMYTKQAREMKHEAAMLRQINGGDDNDKDQGCRSNIIIKLHDVSEDYHYFYMVTEFCKGGGLYDRVIAKAHSKEGHYAERDAACIIRQVVQAVAFLHSKNIVHRDIKLENVLMPHTDINSTDIRLIDFGLSTQHNPDSDAPLTDHVGSVYYVAPEVLNHCYTKTCDLWSIGVLTYALLSGTSPFSGETDAETYEIIQSSNHQVEFSSPDWHDITDMAKDFIRALLQRDPQLRPTAAELLQHEWLQHHHQQEQSHRLASPLASGSKPKSSSSPSRSRVMLQRFKRALHVMPVIRNTHLHG
jgi:calcium-dependent protein kinase